MAAQNPAYGSASGKSKIGATEEYNIEFFPGKVKRQDDEGNVVWEKTGNIYWMYSGWNHGTRKRISPKKKHQGVDGITKVENCPNKHRVREYLSRTAQTLEADHANRAGNDSLISGRKGIPPKLHDVGAEWGGGFSSQLGRSMVGD